MSKDNNRTNQPVDQDASAQALERAYQAQKFDQTSVQTTQAEADDAAAKSYKPGLTFRLASRLQDLEITRKLSEEFHQRSHFAHIPFSHKKRDDMLSRALIPNNDYALILVEYSATGQIEDRELVGGAYCDIGEFMFGTDYRIATCYTFYLAEGLKGLLRGKAAIGLIRAIKLWAKARQSGELMFHVTANTVQTDRFWRRIGGKLLGGNYSLSL